MGRPESPIERDGTPIREFAFWLRDLRGQAGLTYSQIARCSKYATTTMQDAAGGHRLPTLPVLRGFVSACGGDLAAWEAYWAQIRRLVDRHVSHAVDRTVEPPWAAEDGQLPHRQDTTADPATDGWYVESFTALLRLDINPVEALERRMIVATVDGLSEIATAISIPRDLTDLTAEHRLDVELLFGGSLERREQPYESYFRNVIAFPRPLVTGERHEYTLRLRIPPGQPMAPHYVHVPFERSDSFDLRVCFDPAHLPRNVWKLDGVPTTVLYESKPAAEEVVPDRFGQMHVAFRGLRQGMSYGLRWLP